MPHATSVVARRFRRGITLIEVLMSIFIISVGLLGVAALIPLGHYLANRGAMADRAAAAGHAAQQECKARGMDNTATWRTTAGAAVGAPDLVCLDPRGVARGMPATFPNTGTLARVTLYDGLDLAATGNKMTLGHADEVFTIHDDLAFTIANESDPSSLPVQLMDQGPGASLPPPNNPPKAVYDSATTPYNTAVTIAAQANDFDADGDPITITSKTDGTNGSVTNNGNGTLTYTPQSGFSGGDIFTYTISDGKGGEGTTAVRVGVQAQPVTGPTVTWVGADNSTQGNWKGVYGGSGGGQVIVLDSNSVPGYASVSPAGGTAFTWADPSDNRGLERASSTNHVATTWYSSTNFTISVNLTDGQTHRVSLYLVDYTNTSGTPRAETIEVLNAANSQVLNSQSASSFSNGRYLTWDIRGNVIFRITKTGGPNAVVSGVFFTALAPPPNNAPLAVDDNVSTDKGTPVAISVLANDGDADGDALSITSFTQPANGTVTPSGSTFTYTPNSDFTGSNSFNYTIGDSKGGFSTATVGVTVNSTAGALTDDKRMANREFSWFATLVRDPASDQHTLSVAIVQGRNGDTFSALEEVANVAFLPGSLGIGGGDVSISGGTLVSELKVGDWVMLYHAERARWYRIVTLSEPAGAREATLAGRDWDVTAPYNAPKAAIVRNVVGVYERTIRLKTDSLWQP